MTSAPSPYRPAHAERTSILTADEFNVWCALNSMPFNLVRQRWPDGLVEWDLEFCPGTEQAVTVYGTGQQDEALAVGAAFAFIAGAEWAGIEWLPGEGEDEAPAAARADGTLPAPAVFERGYALEAGAALAGEGRAGETQVGDGDDLAETLAAGRDTDDDDLIEDEDDRADAEDAVEPGYALPPVTLLQAAPQREDPDLDEIELAEKARMLETVLRNFRVRGEIMEVKPGPVVTLFELEPAPGTKSSTVINLTEDIARSMSAVTARIAIVPGRSVIGVELPNPVRQMVYLREMLETEAFRAAHGRLPIVLGKDIGGEPVIADLARMPHLLIAGTTGSGKSVGINVMILSLLYRMTPDRCRFIMVDPKMLELSIYADIPHLLTPVVTDPKKAVVALRWAVREMEVRYEAMARLGVRNIESYNARIEEILSRGESLTRRVQVGFDRDTKEPAFEDQEIVPEPLPYIVVVVDEFADLMLVAGKDIEWAIQRLAQMARAAGIHLIMATQRPSVDVITGTIKANFPTRISFAVTSKVDSRTILGDSGAEQLLGQGDMLYMSGGGRITRVHGPFVSDAEVEDIVGHVTSQGEPSYLAEITEEEDDDYGDDSPTTGEAPVFGPSGDSLYDQALAIVARERRVSVSFVQRQLQIGYNRAARIVERMEADGHISAPNHVGRREILIPPGSRAAPSGD